MIGVAEGLTGIVRVLEAIPAVIKAANTALKAVVAVLILSALVLVVANVTVPADELAWLNLAGFALMASGVLAVVLLAGRSDARTKPSDAAERQIVAASLASQVYRSLEGHAKNLEELDRSDLWAGLLLVTGRPGEGESPATHRVRRAFANQIVRELEAHDRAALALVKDTVAPYMQIPLPEDAPGTGRNGSADSPEQ